MPNVWLKSRRIRPLILPSRARKHHQNKRHLVIKLIKLFAAILVPLMIGAFTVITTLHDSNSARYQREADLLRMERQGKLQEETEKRQRLTDLEKIREQQNYNDRVAKEARIQNVYDGYMQDLTNIVLKPNVNLTVPELLFVRSRTLSVLDQIDVKRKWYLIKFLYDSGMLFVKDSGNRYVDLGGGDLSHVRFGSTENFIRKVSLEKIRLTNMVIVNASFYNVMLRYASFDYSDLNGSTFQATAFFGMSFFRASLDTCKFYLNRLENTSLVRSSLSKTIWSFESLQNVVSMMHVDFSDTNLTDSKFIKTSFAPNVRFDRVDFDRSEFFNLKFPPNFQFMDVSLKNVRFIDITFDGMLFLQSNLSESYFEQCFFRNVRFDYVDLQRTQFNSIPSSSKIDFNRVNLIGSNLNMSYLPHVNIRDSWLPNGTFVTSFRSLGRNLLLNSGAEEGQCYANPHGNLTEAMTPPGWERVGNVFQVLYNATNWKMDEMKKEWQSCLFFATPTREHKKVILRQIINVTELAMLINTRRARLEVSGYLGGFEDERTQVTMAVIFRKSGNQNETNIIGMFYTRLFTMSIDFLVYLAKVSNIDRQNKTCLIFREQINVIPIETISIRFELIFERIQSANVVRLGLVDQLVLIIKQR